MKQRIPVPYSRADDEERDREGSRGSERESTAETNFEVEVKFPELTLTQISAFSLKRLITVHINQVYPPNRPPYPAQPAPLLPSPSSAPSLQSHPRPHRLNRNFVRLGRRLVLDSCGGSSRSVGGERALGLPVGARGERSAIAEHQSQWVGGVVGG